MAAKKKAAKKKTPAKKKAAKTKAPAKKKAAPRGVDKKPRVRQNEWHSDFLDAFARTGVIAYACTAAGVDRSTFHKARKNNKGFRERFEAISEDVDAMLEDVAVQRATTGSERTTYRRVKDAGKGKRYRWVKDKTETIVSDRLLILLLRARRPETYNREEWLRCKILEREAGLRGDDKPDEGVILLPEADLVMDDSEAVEAGVTDAAEEADKAREAAEAQAAYEKMTEP